MLKLKAEAVRVEYFHDCPIRYALYDGEWYAVLGDICNVLDLRVAKVNERIEDQDQIRLGIYESYGAQGIGADVPSRDLRSGQIYYYTCINEYGIMDAIGNSKRSDARRLNRWLHTKLIEIRKAIGLEQYETHKILEDDFISKADKFVGAFSEDNLWFNPENQLWYFRFYDGEDLPLPDQLSEDELRNYIWQHRDDDEDQIREFEEQHGYSGRGMA